MDTSAISELAGILKSQGLSSARISSGKKSSGGKKLTKGKKAVDPMATLAKLMGKSKTKLSPMTALRYVKKPARKGSAGI